MSVATRAGVLRTQAEIVDGERDFGGLAVEDVLVEAPGDGEVLVEVHTASVCHSDLSVVTGVRPRPLPMVLGHEASGVIASVGPGVRGFSRGQPVLMTFVPACGHCRSCSAGHPARCEPGNAANRAGTLLSGRRPFNDRDGKPLNQHLGVSGFSRATVVAANSLVALPNDLPLDIAALFGCAVLTGVGAVFNTAGMRPGASVAIFGCGGVGLAALLGALAGGASRVVAVDTRADKLDHARELGADDSILTSDTTDGEIRDLTGGGVDFAFDASGSVKALAQAYASTRPGGAAVVIGLAPPQASLSLSPTDLVVTERRLLGSYMGSTVPARDVPLMIDLYSRGRLPVDRLVAERVALEELPAAFGRLERGVLGRQLIEMQEGRA